MFLITFTNKFCTKHISDYNFLTITPLIGICMKASVKIKINLRPLISLNSDTINSLYAGYVDISLQTLPTAFHSSSPTILEETGNVGMLIEFLSQ